MINIEGIDYNDMQARLMCDDETCLIIIESFYKDVSQKYNRLLSATDNDSFITLAHGIKGACSNVSANGCADIARKLEYKAREEGRENCEQELLGLSAVLPELLHNIAEYLNAGAGKIDRNSRAGDIKKVDTNNADNADNTDMAASTESEDADIFFLNM